MKKGYTILKFKKAKPIFEVKDVSKSFDGRPILKKLSLKVFPGECVGILGPNGCGKTTLFSMCIGEQNVEGGKNFFKWQIDRGDTNTFKIEGRSWLSATAKKRI